MREDCQQVTDLRFRVPKGEVPGKLGNSHSGFREVSHKISEPSSQRKQMLVLMGCLSEPLHKDGMFSGLREYHQSRFGWVEVENLQKRRDVDLTELVLTALEYHQFREVQCSSEIPGGAGQCTGDPVFKGERVRKPPADSLQEP
jgi:hypothetical protein